MIYKITKTVTIDTPKHHMIQLFFLIKPAQKGNHIQAPY